MVMVNSELFRKIADKIEAEPGSHDQTAIGAKRAECGTAYCIGGFALALSGHSPHGPIWDSNRIDGRDYSAQGLLGLSTDDSDLIFSPRWKPRLDLTVPQALRMIADGATVAEVSA